MRKFLLTILFTAIALPIFAKDSGDAAFDILRKYTPETQQTNYIKLQSTINLSDAKRIDAQISELYGNPRVLCAVLMVMAACLSPQIGADQFRMVPRQSQSARHSVNHLYSVPQTQNQKPRCGRKKEINLETPKLRV